MEIRVYATLRDVVGDSAIHIDGVPDMTVRHVLEEVVSIHPSLSAEIFDEEGHLKRSIHIFVNGRNVHFLDGLETMVMPEDAIRIFPPVGGG